MKRKTNKEAKAKGLMQVGISMATIPVKGGHIASEAGGTEGVARSTPTPWALTKQTFTDNTNDIVRDGYIIAHLGGNQIGDSQADIDAAFIVRAVNSLESNESEIRRLKESNEALLEAAKRLLSYKTDLGFSNGSLLLKDIKALEIAISQAEGKGE